MDDGLRNEIGRIVGETAGFASVCWIPRPAGEFDSAPAAKAVDDAVEEIMELISAR